VQVANEDHWPELRMLGVICAEEAKEVSSREAMRRCVEGSPYYAAWVRSATEDLERARSALLDKDLARLGAVAEHNAWRMHALALSVDPAIVYLKPTTLAVIDAVAALRARGIPVYFTLDAGPNPVVLCLACDVPRVEMRLHTLPGIVRSVAGGPGCGVRPAERHLF
jgi:diphosphomevalonate decarboxylase